MPVRPATASASEHRTSRIQSAANLSQRRGSGLSDHATDPTRTHHLAPTEVQYYRRLFDTFDVDKSGYLEFSELQIMLRCLGIIIADEQMEELQAEVDTDGNGTLDFEEFVNFMIRSDELKLTGGADDDERNHLRITHKHRFAGDALWRWAWDVFILILTLYYVVRVPLEWYLQIALTPFIVTVEVILSLVLFADMAIYCNTAFIDEMGRSVEDIKQCFITYLKTTFAFDLLGAIPFDLVAAPIVGIYHTHMAWRILRSLRLLRCVRVVTTLFTGSSVSGLLTPRFVFLQFSIAPVLTSLFYFIGAVHLLAIGWLLVVNDRNVPYDEGLYLTLYTLTTVGYGDLTVTGWDQRLYCCFLFLGGALMNGIVISQMSVFLQKADIKTERKDKMRETLAVLRHFDIPAQTQEEILSFQNHVLEHNLGTSHEELVSSLPETIQESLGLFMKIKYISMVPMFVAASHECKVALANSLINIVFHPQEFIIIAGEKGKEMYFLGHGMADVIHPSGTYLATLRKGMFFGEIALIVEEANRTASIKALTYCDVFRLEKRDFALILRKFPTFKDSVQQQMEDRVKQFKTSNVIPERKRKKDSAAENTATGASPEQPEGDEQTSLPAVLPNGHVSPSGDGGQLTSEMRRLSHSHLQTVRSESEHSHSSAPAKGTPTLDDTPVINIEEQVVRNAIHGISGSHTRVPQRSATFAEHEEGSPRGPRPSTTVLRKASVAGPSEPHRKGSAVTNRGQAFNPHMSANRENRETLHELQYVTESLLDRMQHLERRLSSTMQSLPVANASTSAASGRVVGGAFGAPSLNGTVRDIGAAIPVPVPGGIEDSPRDEGMPVVMARGPGHPRTPERSPDPPSRNGSAEKLLKTRAPKKED